MTLLIVPRPAPAEAGVSPTLYPPPPPTPSPPINLRSVAGLKVTPLPHTIPRAVMLTDRQRPPIRKPFSLPTPRVSAPVNKASPCFRPVSYTGHHSPGARRYTRLAFTVVKWRLQSEDQKRLEIVQPLTC